MRDGGDARSPSLRSRVKSRSVSFGWASAPSPLNSPLRMAKERRLQIARIVVCVALVVATAALRAQLARPRAFEVASVRLTDPQTRGASRRFTDTRVDLVNISLRALLMRVFQIDQPARLVAPDWLTAVNVDIHATIPEGSTRAHVPEMLKTLLATRFGLRTRVEARPTDVYELVVGSGGVQMQEVPAVDELETVFPADPSRKSPLPDLIRDGIEGRQRSIITDRGLILITDRSKYELIRTDRGTQEVDAARLTMAQLATVLSLTVDRPVVDRTRLTGLYRFRIELPLLNFAIAALIPPDATRTNEPSVASPFKAVEKLGLKLESRRSPLETIVVDEIRRAPTDN